LHRSPPEALATATAQWRGVCAKLSAKRALERSLESIFKSCLEMCAGGPAAACSIL